jgi:predicted CopG family antitoxin
MKDEMTTIKISRKTKEKLDKLKIHPRETYEQVILRLIEKEVKK